MALQAETFVEEWFNRNGYFTIRGIKDNIDEIDILAIKNLADNVWDCIHCEVQVSVRPVGYISKLTKSLMDDLKVKSNTSAKMRSEQQIKECVSAWVDNKYRSKKKEELRRKFLASNSWKYVFVHGNVKDIKELNYIQQEGIEVIPFKQILDDLCNKQTSINISGSSAGELVEIINFLSD